MLLESFRRVVEGLGFEAWLDHADPVLVLEADGRQMLVTVECEGLSAPAYLRILYPELCSIRNQRQQRQVEHLANKVAETVWVAKVHTNGVETFAGVEALLPSTDDFESLFPRLLAYAMEAIDLFEEGYADWYAQEEYFCELAEGFMTLHAQSWKAEGYVEAEFELHLSTAGYRFEAESMMLVPEGEPETVVNVRDGNVLDELGLILPGEAGDDLDLVLDAKAQFQRMVQGHLDRGHTSVLITFRGLDGDIDLTGVAFSPPLQVSESEEAEFDVTVHEGTLFLDHVTDGDGLTLPDIVQGDLRLGGLTGVEQVELPQVVTGDVWLDGLREPLALILPPGLGGRIWLNGLEDPSLLWTAQLATHDPDSGPVDLVGKSSVVTVPDGVIRDLTLEERVRHVDPLVVLEALREPDCPRSCFDYLNEDALVGRTGIPWEDEPMGLAIGLAVVSHPNRGAEASLEDWSYGPWSEDPEGVALSQLGVLANPNCPQAVLDQLEEGYPEGLMGLLGRAGELVGEQGLTVNARYVWEVRAFARRFVEMTFAAAVGAQRETFEDAPVEPQSPPSQDLVPEHSIDVSTGTVPPVREGLPHLGDHLGEAASKPLAAIRLLLAENPLGLLQPRDLEVAEQYFGLRGEAPMTLEAVGEGAGITRERVRQLIQRFTQTLAAILRGEEKIRRLKFLNDCGFVEKITALEQRIEADGFILDSELEALLGEGIWTDPIEGADSEVPTHTERYLEVLLASLKLKLVVLPAYGPEWPALRLVLSISKPVNVEFGELARGIFQAFQEDRGWCPPDVFLDRVSPLLPASGRVSGDVGPHGTEPPGVQPDWMEVAKRLSNLLPLEVHPECGVRVPLGWLKRLGVQGRRVLEEEGRPMCLEEILDRIGAALVKAGRQPPVRSTEPLRAAMGHGSNVLPISKSGWWILDSWTQYHTGPIQDFMQEVLEEEGAPMPIPAILSRVWLERPWLPEPSVLGSLYQHNDRFGRDADGNVVLASSPECVGGVSVPFVDQKRSSIKNRFRRALRRLVSIDGEGPHPVHMVVRKVAFWGALDEGTTYRQIFRSSWIRIEGWGAGAMLWIDEDRVPPLLRRGENRSEILATVEPLIRRALMESPGAERRLRELRDELEQQHGVLRPHFYGVARSSEHFTQLQKADGMYIRLAEGEGA